MNAKISCTQAGSFPNSNNNMTPSYQRLQFDPTSFKSELTDFDITEEQRIEILTILWDMMLICADMGWGVEPTQIICTELIKSAFENQP